LEKKAESPLPGFKAQGKIKLHRVGKKKKRRDCTRKARIWKGGERGGGPRYLLIRSFATGRLIVNTALKEKGKKDFFLLLPLCWGEK